MIRFKPVFTKDTDLRRSLLSRRLRVQRLEPRLTLSASYYVSPTGSDSNSGSATSPWLTLQHAVDSVGAGDHIEIASGAYQGCRIGNSGTATAPCVLEAAAGAHVIINAPGASNAHGSDIEIENFNGLVSYWTINGFEVENAPLAAGIDVRNTSHITIENCYGHDNQKWGLFLAFSDYPLITHNHFAYSKTQHGIYDSNSGDYATVTDNECDHNADAGIQFNGDVTSGGKGYMTGNLIAGNVLHDNGSAGGSTLNFDGLENSTVENNLLYNNLAGGIVLYAYNASMGSQNNIVANNTIAMPAGSRWAINISNGSTGNQLDNNLILQQDSVHGSIEIDSQSLVGFKSDHNLFSGMVLFSNNGGSNQLTQAQWQQQTGVDANSFTAATDQLFTALANNDYHLAATSPAIDRGGSLNAPSADLDGQSRPNGAGYDIGCYEWHGSPALPGPPSPPPANLTQEWASTVIDLSSQYSPSKWSADQATGAPNVATYGDNPLAWTANSQNGTTEFLTLGYATPLYANGVTVRETNGNGFVTKVELRNAVTGAYQQVWAGVDPTAPGSPADFNVSFTQTSYLVDAVRVTIDTNHSTTWEEIDAVELLSSGTSSPPPASTIDQWAASVIDFSSQYSSGNWSAAQTLGAPNVTSYGDYPQAWTASSENGTTEHLTLGYSTPVYANGVTVRETNGNGFVTKIEVRNAATGAFETVWSGTDSSAPGAVADFTVTFAQRTYLVDAVRVTIDTNHSTTWEEIDAVELRDDSTAPPPPPPPPPPSGQTSEWASSVIAYSSQYSANGWSAAQALGAPNVTSYGDYPQAWTASSQNGTSEYLTLGYATPLYAKGVTVRETNGNGFVTKIEVRNAATGAFETVWSGTDPTLPGNPADFAAAFVQRTYLADAVRVTIDTSHSSTWEEIDAVGLSGTT